jgi:hypothetical protein
MPTRITDRLLSWASIVEVVYELRAIANYKGMT